MKTTHEIKKSPFFCKLGLHTKPNVVSGLFPPVYCTKCEKMLEPRLRTDIRFKINMILFAVIWIAGMTIFLIGLVQGWWRV